LIAIFGYVDVKYFTDSVKVLQEDVLILINEIADVVHSTVEYFDGCVNKNLGKGFLIVW
jgi:class 3 adenylate cyclase